MVTGYKRYVALFMACLLTFALIAPASRVNVRAEGEEADAWNQCDNAAELGYPDEETVENPKYSPEALKYVVDEAKALGVPNAFYRHNFAEEFNAKGISAPNQITYKVSKTLDDVEGLETNSVDTGVLANTKIDLGEYDFGNYKVGRVVYNMLAKKNLKGKGYLYFGSSSTPFAALDIKRTGDNELEATKSLSIDVRGAALSGKGHIYLRFEADSAKDSTGKILDKSGVKGFLYLESMFFTEGSNPVLDFDLDKEVNTIDQINGSPLHTTTGYGNLNVQVPDGYKSEYSDDTFKDATYELDYLKGRGNSTWQTDKKPYKVKLDKSVDMFGMGKCKHWVLLANYYDYTMIRNKFTYDLAARLGLKYSVKSVFVDVVISGEYCGCYQLCQQIRIDKNNVNIADLSEDYQSEEPGITGGYILTMGASWLTESLDESPTFYIDNNTFRIDKPEYDEEYPEKAKEAQVKYIEDYLNKIDKLVNDTSADASADSSMNASDNASKESWRDYMDEQSLIDYYWIQEFSKNGDAYSGSSTYMYKDRNDKLYWGPIWDFDYVAWGADSTSSSKIKLDYSAFDIGERAPWVLFLSKYDKEFKNNMIKRWEVFRKEMVDAIKDGGTIDQYAKKMYIHALSNYQVRYSNLMGSDMKEGCDDNGVMYYQNASGDPYTLNYYNEVQRFKDDIRDGLSITDRDIDYLGVDPVFEPAKFYVDDKLVAEVHFDPVEFRFLDSEMPKDPVKNGYVFDGWYFIDEEGGEVQYDPTSSVYMRINAGLYKPRDIYAKFINKKDYKNDTVIKFNSDKYYVPVVSADGEVSTEYFDMLSYLGVYPEGISSSKIKWSYGSDINHLIPIKETDTFSFEKEGTYIVVAEYNNCKTSTTVIVESEDKMCLPDDFKVRKNIKIAKGSLSNLGITLDSKNMHPYYRGFNLITYKSEDPEIAEVNSLGVVMGKKKGTTTIYSILTREDDTTVIRSTNVTVGDALPDAVNVKSIKKQGKTKLKISLNKSKGAKGYQIAVYKSLANAEADKNAIIKKYTKKTGLTLKSKKLKKCKKLYVKVRAYNYNGKSKQYSDWTVKSM